MLTSISLEFENSSLNALSDGLQNLGEVLKSSAVYVAGEVTRNFEIGGRPRWQGGKILHKTGNLKQCATSITVADNRAEIGSELDNLPYSTIHQLGGKIIPRRPYMNMPDGWRENVMSEFKTTIMGVSDDTI